MKFRILYEDPHYVAVDKPPGFLVHSPEDPTIRVSPKRLVLPQLRNQLNTYLYPVHRLDNATRGVCLFAKSSEAAGKISAIWSGPSVKKLYWAWVRGWIQEPITIDYALRKENREGVMEARTEIVPLYLSELPVPNARYQTTRISLIEARPQTGRLHQIRRHLSHVSHPILGDSVYGDTVINRGYREYTGHSGLLLWAKVLEWTHPYSGEEIVIASKATKKWPVQ